jgi:hypothetical protein
VQTVSRNGLRKLTLDQQIDRCMINS